MAALNSGLDYVQAPAAVFGIGIVFIMSFLSWIPLIPWVTRVTLPFYRRLNVYSAYEYLEFRFGAMVRTLAACIFVLWRVGWMGAALYVPCLAVRAATGNQLDTTLMVIVLGAVVTLYTMLGGMKAVVWTDVSQFVIMFCGLAATLFFIISQIPGSTSEVLKVTGEAGRLSLTGNVPAGGDMFERFVNYMTTEVTFAGILVVVLLSRATAFTADQVAIQRFQSSRSLDEARKSLLVNACSDTVWMGVLAFVGLALYAYFHHFPFPEGMQNDHVLPYFMSQHFPIGLTGIVIAAIFAASLSSVDAAMNSTTSIIMVDFYNRLLLGHSHPRENLDASDQRRQLRISRAVNICLGVMMIVIAANIQNMGEIYRAGNKILGAFFGPLFGIFVLGMFSRRSHSSGVVIGALAGLSASCFASFFSELSWLQSVCGNLFGEGFVFLFKNLSWQWPSPIGISVTLVAGLLASALLTGDRIGKEPLTYREVMKRPLPEGAELEN
jgi:sodium-coupled monocarboxylate transporter 8/12